MKKGSIGKLRWRWGLCHWCKKRFRYLLARSTDVCRKCGGCERKPKNTHDSAIKQFPRNV